MGGLIMGVFWGAIVAGVGLAALSLSSPLPPRGGAEVVEAAIEVPAEVDVADVDAVDVDAVDVDAADDDSVTDDAAAEAPEGAAVVEATPAEEPAEPVAEPQDTRAPATEIPLPSGSEFNRPPPEPEAALPAPDAAPAANAPAAPALADDVTAPSLDTAPAAQPAVTAEAPAQIATVAGDESGPESPALAPAPVVATGPTALTQPEASETPQVRTALLPQVEASAEGAVEVVADVTPEPEPTPEPVAVPLQTPVFPTIGDGSETVAQAPEVPDDIATDGELDGPTEEPADEVAAVTTPALPQVIAFPQVSQVLEEEVVGDTEGEATDAPAAGDMPAIEAFAAPFDTAEDRPLMAVVLIDEPDSRIELSTLTRFSFPVAFAVDPLHPDASERASAYRDAGFEVVILGSMIAEGATAADTEVALSAAEVTLPEAVALIDTPEGRIQGDRPVLDATVAALSESGHGLLAFPRGLNAAEQSASRAGVPGATVFRFLDDEDQRATVITRFLSRAAFAAAQEGAVIVVGRTRPDTVTALFSWALGGRSEAVALAPLSATMLRSSAP